MAPVPPDPAERADPTDAEIEASLRAGPDEKWDALWAAADSLTPADSYATWSREGWATYSTTVRAHPRPVVGPVGRAAPRLDRLGRWVLQAKAFVGTLNAKVAGSCTLSADRQLYILEGNFPGQTVALMDVITIDTVTSIPLSCSVNSGFNASIQVLDGVIIATMVGPST